jgi:hypothetical protein
LDRQTEFRPSLVCQSAPLQWHAAGSTRMHFHGAGIMFTAIVGTAVGVIRTLAAAAISGMAYIERTLTAPRRTLRHRASCPLLVRCPCCGFRTLAARRAFEVCSICAWEDDGQDDPVADQIWGGPNGTYSLSNARANVLAHGDMYARKVRIDGAERPSPTRVSLLSDLHRILDKTDLDEASFSLREYIRGILSGTELLREDRLRKMLPVDRSTHELK